MRRIASSGNGRSFALQEELPKPREQFGILLQAPWDRAYKGRLEDKLAPHDPIVPRASTAPREVAMGPATLIVANTARDLVERPRRPASSERVRIAGESEGARAAAPAAQERRAAPGPTT